MTDVSLEVLNRRTVLADVHAEAAKIGADGDQLLDSKAFFGQVTALDPDQPGYRTRVREIVAASAASRRAQSESPPQAANAAPAGQQAPDGQWTRADLAGRTPQEVAAALEAGHLVSLGYAPRRRRR